MNQKEIVDLGSRNDSGLKEQSNNATKAQQKIIFAIAFIIIIILLISQGFKIFSKNKSDEVEDPKTKIDVVKRENFFIQDEKDDRIKFSFGGDQSSISEEEKEIVEELPTVLLGANTNPMFIEPIKSSLNKSNSGFMVKIGSGDQFEHSQPNNQTSAQELSSSGTGDNDMFNAPAFKPQVAQKSIYNPHLLLSQGTVIPCSLRGKLISNVGGQISCIVTDDVLSASGAVVLIEKGSVINGFYQGNTVQRGHNEIFVIWQEARTPNQLIIPLYSGSTDPLGANGLSGWVDNHFWERFGNAMVLSLFKDITGALSQNLTKDGKQDYTENTRNDSMEITSEIIKRTADIEPTLYKNQGDKINVFVARDIDFSNVYTLKRGMIKK